MKKHTTLMLLILLGASAGCADLSTAHQGAASETVEAKPAGTIVEHTAKSANLDSTDCVDPVPDDFHDPCLPLGPVEPAPTVCGEDVDHSFAWVPPALDPDADLELAWFRTGDTNTSQMNPAPHGGGRMSFSPNGGLLELSSPVAFGGPTHIHTRDGESGFEGPLAGDLSWTTRLEVEAGGDVLLRAHVAGHEIHRFTPESPDGHEDWEVSTYHPVMTPWGEGVITMHCFERDGEAVFHAHSWSAWSGELIATTDLSTLGVDCSVISPNSVGFSFSSPAPLSLFASPDGEHALLVVYAAPWSEPVSKIARIGLHDGGLKVVDLQQEPSEWDVPMVHSLAIHPHGDRFAFVTGDAKLHLWSMDELAPMEEPRQSSIVMLNNLSYMPSDVSPLAWSPDGGTLARLGTSGQVELWHEDRDEPFAVLQAPEPSEDFNVNFGWGHGSGPATVAFSHDATAVAVRFQHGVALWRVEGACSEQGDPHEAQVALDGPKSLEVGQTGLFQATHEGHDVHSHQFFVDGEPVTEPSWERDLEWTPTQAGVVEVRVEIDDGVHVAVSTLTLEVSEVP
jgi:WD40 repeat protein